MVDRIHRYVDSFPSYIECDVHAKMRLVNDDFLGYHRSLNRSLSPAMFKTIENFLKKKDVMDILMYFYPEECLRQSAILHHSVCGDVVSAHFRLFFTKPVNDMMVRISVDRNLDLWRFSGESQWEFMEYDISERKSLPQCLVM